MAHSPTICYSYSWARNPAWSTIHPSGSEISQYLYNVCARFRILDKIQINTDVTSIRWLDQDEEWELILEHLAPHVGDLPSVERKALAESQGPDKVCLRRETIRAKIVVSAVGGLVEPKHYPNVPGLETFQGEIMHTARWNPDVKLQDKNVIVVGSGCSAAQVVPELVNEPHNAKSVIQLLRSPGWVQPTLSPEMLKWWEANTPSLFTWVPGLQWAVRKLVFAIFEIEFQRIFVSGPAAHQNQLKEQQRLLDYMHQIVPEKYWEILTPDYGVGCKRRVIDTKWFRSLQNPKIELTSLPLTSVQPDSVTLGPGRHYPPMSKTDSKAPTAERTVQCDTLIFANGYETGEWLHPLNIKGRNGRSLYDVWDERGGAQAYLGTAMDGFPNFFMVFGPNTATGHSSVILATENMVNHALHFIQPIIAGDVSTYEVKESAERQWTKNVQQALKKTVWHHGGCSSWYFKPDTGWNSVTYPWSQIHFALRCMFPRRSDWTATYTRKGLLKKRLRVCLAVLAVALATRTFVYARSYGLDWSALRSKLARLLSWT